MKAAAFLDLPVDAEGLGIVALDAVHAEVVMAGIGVFGIDQRQGDEVPAVLGPGFEQRQACEVGRRLHALADGTFADGLQPDLERGGDQVFVRPELARRERGQILRELH